MRGDAAATEDDESGFSLASFASFSNALPLLLLECWLLLFRTTVAVFDDSTFLRDEGVCTLDGAKVAAACCSCCLCSSFAFLAFWPSVKSVCDVLGRYATIPAYCLRMGFRTLLLLLFSVEAYES